MNELRQWQALPLSIKVRMTKERIRQWIHEYGEDGVYISFSGGKDSTALLHLVREDYPDIPAVFFDTGLEYPEIREFVKGFDNVVWLRPKMTFKQVVEKYGYPVISKPVSNVVHQAKKSLEKGDVTVRTQRLLGTYKNKDGSKSQFCCDNWKFLVDAPFEVSDECCNVMKHDPAAVYEKETGRHPFIGQMASESLKRRNAWLETGCNAYDLKRPQSNPMAFWTDSDVLLYLKQNNIPIASVYGDIVYEDDAGLQYDFPLFDSEMKLTTTGCKRTGCMFCGYGVHLNNDQRFVMMKETHKNQYDYIMRPKEQGGLNYKEVIDWLNENGNLKIEY